MNKEQYLQKKEELYQLLKSDNLEKLEKYLIELEDPILNKEMLPIYSVLETSLYNSLSANTLKPTMLELIIKYQPNFQYEETVGNSLIHSYGKMGDIKNLEKVLNNYAYTKYHIKENIKYYHENSVKFLIDFFRIEKSAEQIVNDLRSNYQINLEKFKMLINQNTTGKAKYNELEKIFGAINHFSTEDFISTWESLKDKFSHSLKLNSLKKPRYKTLAGIKNNYTNILKEKVLSSTINDKKIAHYLLNEAEENNLKISFEVMKWKKLLMENVHSANSTEFGKFDLTQHPFSASTLNIINNNQIFIDATLEKALKNPNFKENLIKEFNEFKDLVNGLKSFYPEQKFNKFDIISS